MDEEFAYDRLREIDRGAPGRVMAVGEELRRILAEIIAVRPEVIVDHVEEHHQPALMRGVDQALQLIRRAIGPRRGEGQDAVIAPVPPAREIGDWHQLDRGDAEVRQPVEPALDAGEVAAVAEGAGVKLVEHGLHPWPPAPVGAAPLVRQRIDHYARAMNAVRLLPGRGVWNAQAAGNLVDVAASRVSNLGGQLEPSILVALQRHGLLLLD